MFAIKTIDQLYLTTRYVAVAAGCCCCIYIFDDIYMYMWLLLLAKAGCTRLAGQGWLHRAGCTAFAASLLEPGL